MLVPVAGNINPGELNRRRRAVISKQLLDQDPKRFPPIYIFNIFNREHQIKKGAWGTKLIPACAPGEAYSKPVVLKAIEIQEYDLADGAGNMSFITEDGMALAKDYIGSGSASPGLSLYSTNLEWYGVFASENEKPTSAELSEAKRKLTRMMQAIFADGKMLAMKGPNGLAQIGPNHNLAAQFLGIDPPWGGPIQAKGEVALCPECQEEIKPGAKICKHCHSRLDKKSA